MPSYIPFTLYAFFLEPWDIVQRGLLELAKEKARLMGLNIPAIPKMYSYIDEINIYISNHDTKDLLWPVDQNTIRTLDVSLAKQFIQKPEDKAVRDALSLELLMIHAGLGLLKEAEPYSPDELREIVSSEGSEAYIDEVFVFTMRRIMAGLDIEEDIPIILAMLTRDAKEKEAPPYDWHGAVAFMMVMQTVWRCFKFLNEHDQEFLLQEYYYSAIACGVPVRTFIRLAFDGRTEAEVAIDRQRFSQALLKNVENIPIVTPESGMPFADALKQFLSKHSADLENGFSHQQFAEETYRGREWRDAYVPWLREAIAIFVRVRR